MNSQVSCLAWRQLLPEGVAVSAGPHLENPMPLTDAERLSAGDIGMERRRELENGRTYAKQALALLDFRDVEIPVAADRSPVWPEGIVGSITHVTGGARGHFAAAVARIRDVNAIGIDIEREIGIHPRLWGYFLTQDEFKRILAFPAHVRPVEAQVVWCAKEAVIKAAGRRSSRLSSKLSLIHRVTVLWRVGSPKDLGLKRRKFGAVVPRGRKG